MFIMGSLAHAALHLLVSCLGCQAVEFKQGANAVSDINSPNAAQDPISGVTSNRPEIPPPKEKREIVHLFVYYINDTNAMPKSFGVCGQFGRQLARSELENGLHFNSVEELAQHLCRLREGSTITNMHPEAVRDNDGRISPLPESASARLSKELKARGCVAAVLF